MIVIVFLILLILPHWFALKDLLIPLILVYLVKLFTHFVCFVFCIVCICNIWTTGLSVPWNTFNTYIFRVVLFCIRLYSAKQESQANAKVSVRQRCAHEGP